MAAFPAKDKTNRPPKKQGSSENDGRSDVYDRSEFKIISNWLQQLMSHQLQSFLPVFT